ncbi:MAG: HAD hydrolase-like protein [Rickettsiales bacterium]|nr:HAD hydrolase-like protein [Rickettsiales bacterium]
MKIKNIFWDVDGVLADLNHAYFNFIKNHSKFKDHFKDFEYKDLPEALPINEEKYGAMELKTHPLLGVDLDKEFCASNDYYFDRPLYPNTKEVLKNLNKEGFLQITMSAGFDLTKKRELLNRIFKDLDFIKLRMVEHDKALGMQGTSKTEEILKCMNEFNIKPEECVLVDDRIYNIESVINTGINVIRFMSEFTTPSPEKLKNIIHVKNITELEDVLLNYQSQIIDGTVKTREVYI